MRKSFILLACLATAAIATAQDYLVSSTFLGRKTKVEFFLTFGLTPDYDVDLYRVLYATPGSDGSPDTASGLMCIPVVPAGTALPIVVYGHGTVDNPNDVPSKLAGGYQVAWAYAGFGFITLAADYLGLGDSRGFHPYVHAATQASAQLDMLNAGLEYLDINEPEWDPNYLFVGGYSQGGHASMSLHKEIEDFWSFVYPVTAATHMSGPYSMSGVMRDLILADESYGNPAYIAFIALGYDVMYDLFDDVREVFKEPYATDIEQFYQGTIGLGVLNSRLLTALSAGGNTFPKRMLQDSMIDILANQPDDPFNLALADNDNYNWAPVAPTRLYYCSGDEQVPFENSIIAGITMQSLGAADTEAIDFGAALDHGGCVLPAIINSIAFFQSFLNTSSVVDGPNAPDQIAAYPNPATDEVFVAWDEAADGMRYQLVNSQGAVVRTGWSTGRMVETADLTAGVYTLVCTRDRATRVARFVRL